MHKCTFCFFSSLVAECVLQNLRINLMDLTSVKLECISRLITANEVFSLWIQIKVQLTNDSGLNSVEIWQIF